MSSAFLKGKTERHWSLLHHGALPTGCLQSSCHLAFCSLPCGAGRHDHGAMEQVCIKELFLSCRCYENFVSNLHFLCFLSNSKFFMIILLPHRLAAWLHRRLWCSTDGASMDWSFLHTLQKCTKRNSTTPFQPQSMVPWCI
jgi:hypothetical protein